MNNMQNKWRNLFAFACLFLSCISIHAQVEQKIQVMEYNLKQQKTPLNLVEVAVNNAGSVSTDAQGRATLRFRTLKAGDKVQVRRLEKAGYEIFNKEAVEQWTISGSNTFTIVLCKKERFKELCDNYNKVASASYDAQFKKEKSRLAAERKAGKLKEQEYQQKLQELSNQYEEQLENLDNYVDKFARIDLSELSQEEQAIMDLVEQGKIDEAIARYEDMDLLGQYRQLTDDINQMAFAKGSLSKARVAKAKARDSLKVVIDMIEPGE